MAKTFAKRFLVYLFIGILFLFSCKKEHASSTNGGKPSAKQYKVNFNVNSFTSSTGSNLSANSANTDSISINHYLSTLYYCAYDSTGTLVHFLNQDSTQINFGKITDSLSAGTYTIAMTGTSRNIGCNAFSIVGNATALETLFKNTYLYRSTYLNLGWSDTFFNKFQITVSGNSNHAVTLNRIVGKLEVDILDALPANANQILINISQEALEYTFLNEQLIFSSQYPTAVGGSIITASDVGKTGFQASMMVANNVSPFTVKITCTDKYGATIATATVDNVTCQVNERTILSGKLFGKINQFNVSLNTNWNPPVTVGY